MPTPHGNELNAICLRCENLDFDKPQDSCGWCTKYSREQDQLLLLRYCRPYLDAGQKVYEERLQLLRSYL